MRYPIFLAVCLGCPAIAYGQDYSSVTISLTDFQTGVTKKVTATPDLLQVEETGARAPKIDVFESWGLTVAMVKSLDLAAIDSRSLVSTTPLEAQKRIQIALIESGTYLKRDYLFLQEADNPIWQVFQSLISLIGLSADKVWQQENGLYRHVYQDADSQHLTMTQAVSFGAANILFEKQHPTARLVKTSPVTIMRDRGSPSADSLQAYLYSLLGSEVADTRPRLLRSGYTVRIVYQDGKTLDCEDDLRTDRVNLSLENNRVVMLSIE